MLGKTNLSEWANFRSTRSTSGWSSRGRQTKCPYILDRNPSGSSAGSGSATSANLCTIAIGTETDGSVVSPSSVNGLVGIKPTIGLWSRTGIIPISATQDTAGPMARTVRDAAILLGALTGVDERDAATKGSVGHSVTDYTKFLDVRGLKGKRIGVEKSYLKGHEGVVALYNAAIATLRSQGAEVIEVELVKDINPLGRDEFLVLQYEFKDGLNKYLSGARGVRDMGLLVLWLRSCLRIWRMSLRSTSSMLTMRCLISSKRRWRAVRRWAGWTAGSIRRRWRRAPVRGVISIE